MTRVVRFHEYGEPDVLRIDDVEVPPPASEDRRTRADSTASGLPLAY